MTKRLASSLGITVALALLTAGCGPGAATDDAVRAVERGLPKLTKALKQPARRAAATGARSSTEMEVALTAVFCEGYAIYRDYGGIPTPEEWYDLAAQRLASALFPAPAFLDQAISAYESVLGAVQSGQLAAARVDYFCQFGV